LPFFLEGGNFEHYIAMRAFVIQQQNLMDAAHNLALLPANVWMSTPVGKAVRDLTSPLVAATRELMSFKLLWLAMRTTASLAGVSGVRALSSTFCQEGSHSLMARHHSSSDLLHARAGGMGSNAGGRHRTCRGGIVQVHYSSFSSS
jgi:hypothetical protein